MLMAIQPDKAQHLGHALRSEAGERCWRTAFCVLAAAALAIMLVLSRDFGITGDEPDMDRYGHLVYAYYRSGFADRSALHVPTLSIYGGLFEVACVAAEKLSFLPRFATRHLVNAAVGWLGMVYAGRIAALAAGERAACLTLVLLIASPQYFGHCMNNPKDIPFATAYTASVCYLLQIGSRAPFVTRSLAAKIVAAIAAAIGVRFGGLLLIGYLWLAIGVRVVLSEGRRLRDAARAIALASLGAVAALLLGTVFCPWAIQKPFLRPFEALARLAHFPDAANIPVLFAGRSFVGSNLPASYLPTMFAITTPLVILAAGLASASLIAVSRGERRVRIAMIWFALAFPALWVIARRLPIYNGIRHLLFIYPMLVVLAALVCEEIWRRADAGSRLRFAALAILALGLADPLRFQLANHPNQIAYFNPLVGGLPGAFGRYDIDYWGNSIKQGLDWALREGGIPPDRPIRVTGPRWPTGFVMPAYAEDSDRLEFVGINRPRDADFQIEGVLFYPAQQRRALATGRILHTVSADGVPLCLVKAGGRQRAPETSR
jgi:hypothetical protein